MLESVVLLSLAACVGAAVFAWRMSRLRRLALDRLAPVIPAESGSSHARRRGRPAIRRWRWIAPLAGLAVFLLLFVAVGWSATYSFAIASVVLLVAAQIESHLAQRRAARLESQLADAIDLMVGALGAGAGASAALETAIRESRRPLRPLLEEISGRIRYGDDPEEVFSELADRVPLETFLLFTSTLAVHWEVGGSLAPTLATVGRTIRDRIEMNRRIQSNITQSQFSTYAVLLLTYFIALLMWRNNPDQMRQFLSTSTGATFVAGSIILQAVGMAWMAAISKPRF